MNSIQNGSVQTQLPSSCIIAIFVRYDWISGSSDSFFYFNQPPRTHLIVAFSSDEGVYTSVPGEQSSLVSEFSADLGASSPSVPGRSVDSAAMQSLFAISLNIYCLT
ncbi:hypothetical protein PAHAL_6G051100 [Panicum hallii]|uniref:Uncharacterized protein n=1 Tax=Panicum hallii TaxID=206008 RepID=A0A2S3I0K2_9POAL|nr:hypothetical protein PAHAL_6G051100 [Panicum hallii]